VYKFYDETNFRNTTLLKKALFMHIFLKTYRKAHYHQSLIYCFKDNKLFCKHYFNPLNTFMRKGKDPDPGGPKTYGSGGSGSGSVSATLLKTLSYKLFLSRGWDREGGRK
jgi:hypothetical protein